jgi:hypothetical protein
MQLIGRAVDIVHAAVRAAGREVVCTTIWQDPGSSGSITVLLQKDAQGDIEAARRTFTCLGVPDDVRMSSPYGDQRLVDLSAAVPALDGMIVTVVVRESEQAAAPGDVDALIAEVDRARAAAEEDCIRDAHGDPVPDAVVPEGVDEDWYRRWVGVRVPARDCPHYIAVSEERAGWTTCERCG